MIEIIHISDLHFGRQTKKAQLLLEKVRDKFKIGEQENRYLLVTGDIVQDGGKGQFKTAKKALISFKGKVHVVPGNHDYGLLGFVYSEASAKNFDKIIVRGLGINHLYFPKELFSKMLEDKEGNKVLIIGLNSCSETPHIFDIAAGDIGDKQRQSLDDILSKQEYRDIPKIIFLHHIPHRRAQGIGMSLKDHRKLMAVARNRVNAFAFGHEGSMQDTKEKEGEKIEMSAKEQKRLKTIKKMSIPAREMKLRSGKGQGIRYYLDANKSVDEMACYHITVAGKEVSAELVRLR